MASTAESPTPARMLQSGQTIALRIIAAILIAGALHLLSSIFVPFMLALTVSLALSPMANWMESKGCPRMIASFAGLIGVALILLTAVGLIVYQAGSMAQQSDRYIQGFSKSLEEGAKLVGAEGLLPRKDDSFGSESAQTQDISGFLQQNARIASTWAVRGVGGLAGLIGGAVLFLAFLFYMLQTRDDWVDRLQKSARQIGLRPEKDRLMDVRDQVGTYIKTLFLVSLGYVVVITLALWAIGIPQPLLWGVLTGLLEIIPFFGTMIATALPTVAAFGTSSSIWQPLAVLGVYVGIQTFEGYVVTPMLYGKAVKIDPVTVLFGVLFFGFLWGPLGLALAMPTMILLRGLISITPETPALDALVDGNSSS